MDIFCEQLVQKNLQPKDNLQKFLIIFLTVFLGILVFLIATNFLGLLFGFILCGALFFGGFYWVSTFDVEYEYIVTNGELDIDKIIAQKKRKRVLTVSAKSFTAFGQLSSKVDTNADVKIIDASDGIPDNMYYAEFNAQEVGQIRLIFSPNEKTIENLKHFIPRNLRS